MTLHEVFFVFLERNTSKQANRGMGGDGKIGVFNEKVAKLVQNNVPLSFCNYAILAELSS